MWKKLTEAWVWVVAFIDLVLSIGLSQLLVQWAGWRWSWGMTAPLDASNSIVSFTVMFGVLLPPVALLVGLIVAVEVPKLVSRN